MTRYGLRKKRTGMAPPSYLPRVHMRTGSESFNSVLRRLASSTQCEQFGLTRVWKASGLTTSFGSPARDRPARERRTVRVRMRMPRSGDDRGIVTGRRLTAWSLGLAQGPLVELQLARKLAGGVGDVGLVDVFGRHAGLGRRQLGRVHVA